MAKITISNVNSKINITDLSKEFITLLHLELGQDIDITMELDDSDNPQFEHGDDFDNEWEDSLEQTRQVIKSQDSSLLPDIGGEIVCKPNHVKEEFSMVIVDILNDKTVIALKDGVVGLFEQPDLHDPSSFLWKTIDIIDYKDERRSLVETIITMCDKYHGISRF